MSKDIRLLTFKDFLGGMNKRLLGHLLADNELQVATDTDFSNGGLSGLLDVGSAISQNSSNATSRWICFTGSGNNPSTGNWASAGVWQYSNEVRYTMRDGNKVYTTRVGIRPAIVDGGGNTYTLGIPPPESLTYATSGGGSLTGTFAWGISYTTWDGFESNIQSFPIVYTLTNSVITFSSLWPNDVRVAKVSLWKATVTAGVIGTYHRLKATTDRNVSTLTDDGLVATTTEPLTWTSGGYPGNDGSVVASVYTSDHSPAPPLTCLANRMHAMASGLAVFSGGIVIGAVGNTLRWSQNGYPLYWPEYAAEDLDHPVEAIIVYTGYAVILTSGGTYSLSGSSDSSMNNRRLEIGYPIRPGWGKSAVRITGGHLYVAKEGLVFFDGAQSRLISQFKLPSSYKSNYFDTLTIYDAGYYNNEYRIAHSTGQLIVDLQDGIDRARFSESSTIIRALAPTDFRSPIIADARGNFPGNDVLESVAAAIIGSATAQWITPSSTTSFALGDQIQVSSGTNSYEVTQIQGISGSQIYGIFSTSQAAGATIAGGSLLGRNRFGCIAERSSSKIYVVGGVNLGSNGNSALSTAMVYNAATSSAAWAAAGTMAEARCEFSPALIGTTLFVFGGTNSPGVDYASGNTLYAMETSNYAWSSVAVTGSAGTRRGHASAYDASGVYNTGTFWIHGGQWTGVLSDLHSYTIATKAWATISGAGSPGVVDHAMAYVGGAQFTDNHPRLFVFGGMTTTNVASGTNTVFCHDLTAGTWSNDDSSEATSLSSAQAVGVPKRARHVWQYHNFSKKIYLHGGIAPDGSALADFWEFDPVVWITGGTGSRTSAWVNGTANILNVDERYWHGGAMLTPNAGAAVELYLIGGASASNPFGADVNRILCDDLTNQNNTPGLYVLKNSDSGAIRRTEASSLAVGWTAQTKDYLGDNPAAYKWANKLFADYVGDVNIAVYAENAQVGSMLTLSSASRAQEERWLPFSNVQTASTSMGTTTTAVTISSISGNDLTSGTYNLSIVRSGGAPPTFVITWGSGTAQTFTNGWPTSSFPISLVGSSGRGTLVIADNNGPPGSNGTYTDAVTVTVSQVTPRGRRLSFRMVGATAAAASSSAAGQLYSATFEMGEEAND